MAVGRRTRGSRARRPSLLKAACAAARRLRRDERGQRVARSRAASRRRPRRSRPRSGRRRGRSGCSAATRRRSTSASATSCPARRRGSGRGRGSPPIVGCAVAISTDGIGRDRADEARVRGRGARRVGRAQREPERLADVARDERVRLARRAADQAARRAGRVAAVPLVGERDRRRVPDHVPGDAVSWRPCAAVPVTVGPGDERRPDHGRGGGDGRRGAVRALRRRPERRLHERDERMPDVGGAERVRAAAGVGDPAADASVAVAAQPLVGDLRRRRAPDAGRRLHRLALDGEPGDERLRGRDEQRRRPRDRADEARVRGRGAAGVGGPDREADRLRDVPRRRACTWPRSRRGPGCSARRWRRSGTTGRRSGSCPRPTRCP